MTQNINYQNLVYVWTNINIHLLDGCGHKKRQFAFALEVRSAVRWRLPAASSDGGGGGGADMKIWWMFVRSPSGGVRAARVCVWMCAGDWGQGMPLCMPQCGLSKAAPDVIKISTRLLVRNLTRGASNDLRKQVHRRFWTPLEALCSS